MTGCSYPLCLAAVVTAGLGLGAQLVAAFAEAQRAALARGFPDNLNTYRSAGTAAQLTEHSIAMRIH